MQAPRAGDGWFAREERCRKTMKTLLRAMLMRLLAAVLLTLALLRAGRSGVCLGLVAFVLVVTVSGLLPLWQELKKQKALHRQILEEEA